MNREGERESSTFYEISVADEKTAAVTIPNSFFTAGINYYGYLVYGEGFLSYTNPSIIILSKDKGDDDSSAEKEKSNYVGLIVGIIIAVVAVIAVVVVISVFFAWRRRERRKRMSEADGEKVTGSNVQFVFFFF
jgi:hypothetical protein